jgi:hypothetical protein
MGGGRKANIFSISFGGSILYNIMDPSTGSISISKNIFARVKILSITFGNEENDCNSSSFMSYLAS